MFERDIPLQVADRRLLNVNDIRFLFIKPYESELDALDICETCLADPFLETAAVGQVLLEDERALGLLDVGDPPAVGAGLNECTDHALLLLPGGTLLHAVNADGCVDVDVVDLQLHVFL